jgi:hypothetical protein
LLPWRRRWDSFRHRINLRRARSPLAVQLARPIRAEVNHRSALGAKKSKWKALQRLAVIWRLISLFNHLSQVSSVDSENPVKCKSKLARRG